MIKYIKMQSGDTVKDIHPGDVQNYKLRGFSVVDTKAPKKKAAPKTSKKEAEKEADSE